MAYGKNKKLSKGGKKGSKKKQQDPFLRKNWYDVKAPTYLSTGRRVGRTMVTKTTGQRLEADGLKGRVAEFNLADVVTANEDNHKKIKLEIQDITGRACLTDFHGLSLTRDKMCHMIRKRHSLVEVKADVKTNDGYVVRICVIAFTQDAKDQVKVFSYAQSAQIKKIRRKITEVLAQAVGEKPLKGLVDFLVADSLEKDIKKSCHNIFPLDPVHIFKVKLVRKPKVDFTKLMEIHDNAVGVDDGVAIAESEEAKNLLTA
jgi:small subunit ribosomal protein S3Ae